MASTHRTSTHRFDCASSSLRLKGLLRNTRCVLWMCFGLGVATHLSLTQIGGFETEDKVVKPLTTQFIKRQPRLSKPLELKKRPQPKRRRMQRKMVSVKAEMQRDQRGSCFQPSQVLRGLARPSVDIGRIAGFGSVEVEPRSIAGIIEGAKEVEQKIDMSLELLDIDALNTGQHHAMVIQDPTDKRNITGFLNLAYIYSDWMTGMEEYKSSDMTFYAVTRLVEKVNEWTLIKTRIAGRVTFDSPELFKTPWVYTRAGHSYAGWKIPYSQAQNLGRYFQQGGFWIADGLQGGPRVGQDIPMRDAVRDALATVDHKYGRDWEFEKLPFDHPIFHCFFEFPDGAPVSADSNRWGPAWADNYPVEGVFLEKHLVVLYTNKNFVLGWVGRSRLYPQYDFDGMRVFQFGVNTIVFALTQEGSITYRLMTSVK